MASRPLLIALLFQAVWIITALAAARGLAWPGVAAAAALVLLHLATIADRPRALLIVAAAAAIGAICESCLAISGLVRYTAGWSGSPALAPAWLIALWAAFAAALPAMRTMLAGRPRGLVAALGAALGLLSYLAGERLGALAFPQPRAAGYLAVGLVWAVALPLLLALGELLAPAGRRDLAGN